MNSQYNNIIKMSLEIRITVIIFLLILRCSKNIEGQFYDVTAGGSLQPCRIDPQTSLPDGNFTFFPNKNSKHKQLLNVPTKPGFCKCRFYTYTD